MDELSKPVVLDNVYLAKNIGKYCTFITTDVLNMNTHLLTDHRVPPSIIGEDIQVPHFKNLTCEFLQHQLELNSAEPLNINSNINEYVSAVVIYYVPSDLISVHSKARDYQC